MPHSNGPWNGSRPLEYLQFSAPPLVLLIPVRDRAKFSMSKLMIDCLLVSRVIDCFFIVIFFTINFQCRSIEMKREYRNQILGRSI